MSLVQFLSKKILPITKLIWERSALIGSAIKSLKFPRFHLTLLGVSAAIFITTAFSLVSDRSENQIEASSFETEQVELPTAILIGESPSDESNLNEAEIVEHEIRNGENLALIGEKYEITPMEIHNLSSQKPHGKLLRKIRPGERLSFAFDNESQLLRVDYQPDPLTIITFNRKDNSFKSSSNSIAPKREVLFSHGVIEQNLFYSSQKIGLADALTMRLAQIFQWDIDFVLDLRPGDSFFLMYEELFVNDEFVGHGDILAAEFINQGESYRAVFFKDDLDRGDFFNLEGESMRKAFLRAPVEFSRISSSFNLNRVHPLFQTVRPHRGIDYAAPTGTPVLAAGDGRIKTASRTRPNGKYVVIQHGQQFVTKYLHLSRFGRNIKAGKMVKQGQVIGYVGQTGYATGPHLHYEFLVNGAHKNPRTVSLPQATPIAKKHRQLFALESARSFSLLENYKGQMRLAAKH